MPPRLAPLLAHQGGWDEALYVAVPMAVLVLLLWVAQRRAQAEQESEGAAGAEAAHGTEAADRTGHDEH